MCSVVHVLWRVQFSKEPGVSQRSISKSTTPSGQGMW
jgi:hypothetical protein